MAKQEIALAELWPLMEARLAGGETVTFGPHGTSMLPLLYQGRDKVTLAPVCGPLKKYDLPLYRRADGSFVLHRIVEAGDTYTCIGDNQFVLEHGVRQEQMLAVVCAFTRNGKNYAVTDPGYQVYCRFWHYTRPLRRVYRAVRSRLARLVKPLVKK